MMIEQPRQPKGVPTGGQFAGTARSESVIHLAPAGPAVLDPVRDVDEVIRAADQEVAAALRAGAAIGDRLGRAEHEFRTAQRALDAWHAEQWGKPAAGAPHELLTEVDRTQRARTELKAEADQARRDVADARARVAALASHYPWAGTDTPIIRFVGGLQRPVDVAPSGRFGFYEFPHDDPRHGSIGIAMPAGDQWGPYESVTGERLATIVEADGTASFAAQDYVDYRIEMPAEDVRALKAYVARRRQIGAAA